MTIASIHVGGGIGLLKIFLNGTSSSFPVCKPPPPPAPPPAPQSQQHSPTQRQWRSSTRLLLRSVHNYSYHPCHGFTSKSTSIIMFTTMLLIICYCLLVLHLSILPWSTIYEVSAFPFLRHVPTRSYTASISSSSSPSSVFLYRRNFNFNTDNDNNSNNSSSFIIMINNETIYDDPSSLATSQYAPKVFLSSNAVSKKTSRMPSISTQKEVVKRKNITSHNNNTMIATITNNTTITNRITNRITLPPSVTSSLGDIMSIAPTWITPILVATTIASSGIIISPVNEFFTTVGNDSDDGTRLESDTSSSTTTTTTNKQSLQEMYQIYHPLDRMILTANGNVQRLISSYYDTKHYSVHVNVIYCQMRQPPDNNNNNNIPTNTVVIDTIENNQDHDNPTRILPQIWDRKVELCLYKTTRTTSNTDTTDKEESKYHHVFCRATSIITIHDPQCQQLIALQQIGIGQLFRYYNILPNFTLHNAGPLPSPSSHNDFDDNTTTTTTTTTNIIIIGDDDNDGGGGNFWREYTLSCPQLSCWIREEFPPGLWNISKTFP